MLLKLQKDFGAVQNKHSHLSLRVGRKVYLVLGVFNKINILLTFVILETANRLMSKARTVNVNLKSISRCCLGIRLLTWLLIDGS